MVLIPSGAETNAAYHASGAWGSSRVNDFIKSPEVAWLRHTGKLPHEQSTALTLGSALHARFDGTYDRDFAPGPKVASRRTKAWTDAAVAHPKQTLLLPSEVAVIDNMEQSIRKNAFAACMLDGAQSEVGVRRRSPWGAYDLQCRMDLYRPGSHVADLKTTSNLDGWVKSVTTYGYFRQAAFYRFLVEEETGERLPFSFIVVEKAKPYRCRVIDLDDVFLDAGWADVQEALVAIGQRYANTDWTDPGYAMLEAPGWLQRRAAVPAEQEGVTVHGG